MRLLNVHSLEFAEYPFEPRDVPKYVIASHRWSRGAEATLEEIHGHQNTAKSGYQKVLGFAQYVQSHVPGIDWIWIDTCCIDNRNSQEVSTAINSMFRWYAKAEACLAYLPDIVTTGLEEFSRSEWWTRGWTLQELLAPKSVVFLTKSWQIIGYKGSREILDGILLPKVHLSLDTFISSFTGIPENVLRNYEESKGLRAEEKLSWATGRKTSREEDMSYCLIGLLDVAMVANYGEGGDKARRRLLREMTEASHDTGTFMDSSYMVPSSSAQGSGLAAGRTESQSAQDVHHKLLASIYFPQLGDRRDQIATTYHGTYQWALLSTSATETEWSNLVAWLRDLRPSSRFYWINAKPGAGKSSLIRFLEENLDASQHMQPWSQSSPVLLLSYYFWNPGNTLQKTLVGLLRTILYQILSRFPDMASSYLPPHKSNLINQAATISWTNFELRQCLREVLSVVSSSARILFLIDGLDEMDGTDENRDDLIEFLKELARYPNVKICVSSRPWTVFQDAFNMCPQLRLEDLNSSDISVYVQGQLQSQDRFRQMLSYDSRAERIIVEVVTKAKGVFLWSRLVVKELLRGIRDGDSLETLEQKIRVVPDDLNDYFSRLLDSIDAHHRSQASALLQIALHQESEWTQLSSLRLLDLIFVAHGSSDFALSEQLEHYVHSLSDANALTYTLDSALRMLFSRCKGLLECYFHQDSAFRSGTDEFEGDGVTKLPRHLIAALQVNKNVAFDLRIDFMHRSLRDYFLEPDHQRFLYQYTSGCFDARNYLRNARLCQLFVCRNWRLNTEPAVGLGSYVICTMSSPQFRRTARCAKFAKRLQPAIDYMLSNLEYIPRYWYISNSFESWIDEQSSFLTLAIDFEWTGYLNEALTAKRIREKRGRPVLDYVLRPRLAHLSEHDGVTIGNQYTSPELVKKVLSLGADPNEVYQGTPLWPLFLSFVADQADRDEVSEEAKRAYVLSLEVMMRGGARLSTDERELSEPDSYGEPYARSFSHRWPLLARENRRTRGNLERIAVVDVIECLRFFLGDAVDELKTLDVAAR